VAETQRPTNPKPLPPAISTRSTSLGKTLVDGNGRTLYLFEGDRTNISTLSAAGTAVWPRFASNTPVKAGNGVQAALIGTTTTPTGVKQVTYQGHPLYYYVGDSNPGSTRGQGLRVRRALVRPRAERQRHHKRAQHLGGCSGRSRGQLRVLRIRP
jgi:predicted lipoprotein with Yx(FWY)xxD motif